jgi:hypothetical protein
MRAGDCDAMTRSAQSAPAPHPGLRWKGTHFIAQKRASSAPTAVASVSSPSIRAGIYHDARIVLLGRIEP